MMENGLFSNKAEMPPSYPKKDFEVIQPPEDSVSALAFSPAALLRNYLIAGSWDNSVSFRIVKCISSCMWFNIII